MAYASGTITLSTTTTNDISGKITYAESNQNIASNTTDLNVKLIYSAYNATEPTQGTLYIKLTINGTAYTDSKYVSFSSPAWQTTSYTVWDKTITIAHNSDGSKTTSISLDYGYVAGTTGLSASSGSKSGIVLQTIPRTSSVSATNAIIADTSHPTTVTITSASTSFRHKVTFSYGSYSLQVAANQAGGSFTVTMGAVWGNQIPNANSMTVTVTCRTYNGNTSSESNYIGQSTSTFTASIPSTAIPTAAITATLSGTKGDSNQILKGLTTVQLNCPGGAALGATVSSRQWSGGSTATTAKINPSTASVGSTTYTCTITDSRGKTNSASYTVTVVDPKSTISGATTGTFGSNYALTISRINSNFKHTVVFYINSSYTSGNRTDKTTSDTYTIPAAWGAAIPTTTSTTVHITCTTYNGSTSLGSVSKDITVSIPSSWAPTVSITKSYADRGSQNQILAGTTTLTVTASGAASSGATISSYSWSGGYVSGTGASKTHKPASAGTYTYTVTITDSRNKTASATVTETFQNPSSTFTCANSVNFGAALDVSIARLKASYTHIVRYYISSSYTHDENDGGHASTSYTIPANWAACVPTTSSTTMTVTCYTYNGSTQIGSTSKSVTVNVPSSWLPAIGSISATGVSTFNSQYLKGESKATIAVSSVTASTGANISKYKYAGNNISTSETASTATSNSRTTSLLTSVGTNTYTVTVTDSRGRSASKTVSIEVKDYAKPTVRLTVGRYDDQGNPDNFGEYGKMTLTGSFTNVTGNTWTLVCKQKPKTSGTYVTVNTWSNQNNAVNRGSDLFLADVDKTYDCYAIITDAVGYSAEVVVAMSTGRAIQDIYKDRMVSFFSTANADTLSQFSNTESLFLSNAKKNALNGRTFIPDGLSDDGFTKGWFDISDLSGACLFGSKRENPRHVLYGGENLNDYIIPGTYFIPANSYATNITNIPDQVAGTLYVKSLVGDIGGAKTYQYLQQEYHMYHEHSGSSRDYYYVRYGDSGNTTTVTWQSWRPVRKIVNNRVQMDGILYVGADNASVSTAVYVQNSSTAFGTYNNASGTRGLYDSRLGKSLIYLNGATDATLSSFANHYHNGSLSWDQANSLELCANTQTNKDVASGTAVDLYTYATTKAGNYLLCSDFSWATGFTSLSILYLEERRNGSALAQRYVRSTGTAGGGQGLSVIFANVPVGDTLVLRAYQATGSALSCKYRFTIFRLIYT